MSLERYPLKEIVQLCTNAFYHYMVYSDKSYNWFTEINEIPTIEMHDRYMKALKDSKEKYLELTSMEHLTEDQSLADVIAKQRKFHSHEYGLLKSLNMAKQIATDMTNADKVYSHSVVLLPLNKLINSYYDDLWLEVLFYDDVCTPAGQFEKYMKLPVTEKEQFLRENTSITHMAFKFFKSDISIVIKGECNADGRNVFPAEYGDFANLNLSMLNSLYNNDLRQKLQEKIDLDKENLTFLARLKIRGDVYELYCYNKLDVSRYYSGAQYYIRYVCCSTGRVYYNALNINNLSVSEYFDPRNYESYLMAWWNITHVGAKIEGNAVISC